MIGSSCSGTARGARAARRDVTADDIAALSRRVPRRLRLPARRLPAARRSTRSTPGRRCWSPRRPVGQDGRRRVRGRTCARGGQARPSTRRRSRRCRTRSTATSCARHGARRVGLLTGDNAINGDAPVVVMTTEVLRNMIYARSPRARRPALRRARRGALPAGHLPRAGVGGGDHPPAAPTCGWCACRRRCRTPRSWPTGSRRCAGPTAAVIEERRPVELRQPVPGRRPDRRATCTCCRRSSTGGPNPEADRLDGEAARGAGGAGARAAAGRRLLHARGGVEVVERLDERADAAGDLLHLQPQPAATTPREPCLDAGAAPHRPATSATASARSSTRRARRPRRRRPRRARLRPRSLAGLEAGVAAHHAGHGAAVQGGGRGLLRRGAREGGVRHRDARARHQHAGADGGDREADEVHRRAPRVPDAGGVHAAHRPGRAAGHRRRSATPSCCGPVRALRPGRRAGRRAARSTLTLGVPADLQHGRQPRAPLPARARPTTCSTCRSPSTRPTATSCGSRPGSSGARSVLAELLETAASPYGDIDEYRRSHRADGERRSRRVAARRRRRIARTIEARRRHHAPRREARRAGGGAHRRATARRRCPHPPHHTEPHPRVAVRARLRPTRRSAVGEIELPTPFAPNRQSYQREVARAARPRSAPAASEPRSSWPNPACGTTPADPIRSPTIHELDDRLKAAAQAERVAREVEELRATGSAAESARSPAGSTACCASSRRGATSTAGRSPSRASGSPRSSTSATCSWSRRCGKGCSTTSTPPRWPVSSRSSPTSTAALTRRPRRGSRRRKVRERCRAIAALATELQRHRGRGRPRRSPRARTRRSSRSHYAWAAGEALDDVVEDEDLSGGDFVRNVKQLIDLLRQVADVSDQPTSAAAREAAARLFRGVVAASSAVATSE